MCRGNRLSTKARADGIVGEILTISSHEVVWRMLDLVAAADETSGVMLCSLQASQRHGGCLRAVPEASTKPTSGQAAKPPQRQAS